VQPANSLRSTKLGKKNGFKKILEIHACIAGPVLLAPVLGSAEIWKGKFAIECTGDEIGELLNINIEDFLPEFLQSAYVKTEPDDGSQVCIAAVIDFENDEDAEDFYILNKTESPNKRILRIGSIVYLIKGTGLIVDKGIESLKPKPKKNGSDNAVVEKKGSHQQKFFIIGAGFFILLLIVIIIFIISGKNSGNNH